MKYCFGDLVVVEYNLIGVVVKSWVTAVKAKGSDREPVNHEVYVRNFNSIREYPESKMQRYMVRHKELSEEEQEWQSNAMNSQ